MEELEIKTVAFMTAELVAAKDEATGRIYVGISYICKGVKIRYNKLRKFKSDPG